jgi:hypothetical protein
MNNFETRLSRIKEQFLVNNSDVILNVVYKLDAAEIMRRNLDYNLENGEAYYSESLNKVLTGNEINHIFSKYSNNPNAINLVVTYNQHKQ